jgi:hypothetical protein
MAVNKKRKIKEALSQLEAYYDSRLSTEENKISLPLSPEVEQFLKEWKNASGRVEAPSKLPISLQ